MTEMITITKNEREYPRLVTALEHERLCRIAFRSEELSEADLALIAVAEVPPEYAYLDEEIVDWQP